MRDNTGPESNLNNAYLEAYRLACKRMLECDSETVCMNAKAEFSTESDTFAVGYFGREYRIRRAAGEVIFEDGPAPLNTIEKTLVLHYLITARPAPLTGRLISFKEIPNGGSIYYSTFKKRAIDPLVNFFAGDIGRFAQAGRDAGGKKEALGDAGIVINIFPLVPVTYVIWKGDAEIASSGTILFDASAPDFLPVEDVVLAASYGSHRLIVAGKKRAPGGS